MSKNLANTGNEMASYMSDFTNKFNSYKSSRIEEKIKFVEESDKFDLCFMVDCTGSMSPHLNAVKDKIKSLIFDIQRRYCGCQARLGNSWNNAPRTFRNLLSQSIDSK